VKAIGVPAIQRAPRQTSPTVSAHSATKWTSGGQRDSVEFQERGDINRYGDLQRNTGITRGKKLVVLVGQKKAVAIAVRNVPGRRRWSKLSEWLKPQRAAQGALP
jgi:hypothetical protein